MIDGTIARQLWTVFEPVHALVYFTPQPRAALEAAGLRGFWRGYFAARSAPLGAVGPGTVGALFYGFAPRMVERALPSVWDLASTSAVLEARLRGSTAALTALDVPGGAAELDRAATVAAALAGRAVDQADVGGRALGAANASLPWPQSPLPALWHGCTVLRELRGDGHVAALLTAGLTGLEALVLRAGVDLERQVLQPARGWTDDEWLEATENLRGRGLLDAGHRTTPRGTDLLADVETVTDHLAAQLWAALGVDGVERFVEVLTPVARAAFDVLPAATPIGLAGPPKS